MENPTSRDIWRYGYGLMVRPRGILFQSNVMKIYGRDTLSYRGDVRSFQE